jgi:hypothetical protein
MFAIHILMNIQVYVLLILLQYIGCIATAAKKYTSDKQDEISKQDLKNISRILEITEQRPDILNIL